MMMLSGKIVTIKAQVGISFLIISLLIIIVPYLLDTGPEYSLKIPLAIIGAAFLVSGSILVGMDQTR